MDFGVVDEGEAGVVEGGEEEGVGEGVGEEGFAGVEFEGGDVD